MIEYSPHSAEEESQPQHVMIYIHDVVQFTITELPAPVFSHNLHRPLSVELEFVVLLVLS